MSWMITLCHLQSVVMRKSFEKLGSAEVRGVFQRHGDRLKLLFDRYSKADDSDIHEERAAET